MAKKEIKKLSPGACVRSLAEFNTAVVGLVSIINATMPLMDPKIREFIEPNVREVESFYRAQENE